MHVRDASCNNHAILASPTMHQQTMSLTITRIHTAIAVDTTCPTNHLLRDLSGGMLTVVSSAGDASERDRDIDGEYVIDFIGQTRTCYCRSFRGPHPTAAAIKAHCSFTLIQVDFSAITSHSVQTTSKGVFVSTLCSPKEVRIHRSR